MFLYNSRHSGLAKAPWFLTLWPAKIFLTATSTFFPLTVYGMSVIGRIKVGTCLALKLVLICFLNLSTTFGSNSKFSAIFKKRITLSSPSGVRWPTWKWNDYEITKMRVMSGSSHIFVFRFLVDSYQKTKISSVNFFYVYFLLRK